MVHNIIWVNLLLCQLFCGKGANVGSRLRIGILGNPWRPLSVHGSTTSQLVLHLPSQLLEAAKGLETSMRVHVARNNSALSVATKRV